MTEEKLAELEALAAAATPGPWKHDADEPPATMSDFAEVFADDEERGTRTITYNELSCADARFIAAARDAVPALIAWGRGQQALAKEWERLRREAYDLYRSAAEERDALRAKVAEHEVSLASLREYTEGAIERHAAQHAEIERLRQFEALYRKTESALEAAGLGCIALEKERDALRADLATLRDLLNTSQTRRWMRLEEALGERDAARAELNCIKPSIDRQTAEWKAQLEQARAERDAALEQRRIWRCETHPDAAAHGWGCPDCVATLRMQASRTRGVLERCRDVLRVANVLGLPPGGGLPVMVADIEAALADTGSSGGKAGG